MLLTDTKHILIKLTRSQEADFAWFQELDVEHCIARNH